MEGFVNLSDQEMKHWVQERQGSWPQPGEFYLHYKGGLYVIVCSAVREHDGEVQVTYQSVKYGWRWVRSLHVFLEKFGVSGQTVQRFRKIDLQHEWEQLQQQVRVVTAERDQHVKISAAAIAERTRLEERITDLEKSIGDLAEELRLARKVNREYLDGEGEGD
jgi:hypothetical protein